MLYRLSFYVPVNDLEAVKEAVFAAGGGCYGDYDRCSWQALGQGQFRPLSGSTPYLGRVGQLEQVDEYKVEIVVEERRIEAVVKALLKVHPYQQPAYGLTRLLTLEDFGFESC